MNHNTDEGKDSELNGTTGHSRHERDADLVQPLWAWTSFNPEKKNLQVETIKVADSNKECLKFYLTKQHFKSHICWVCWTWKVLKLAI